MELTLDMKLSSLTELSQRKLLNILTKIGGKKDFIIDGAVIKPLNKIIGVSKLRLEGVDKIYKLSADEIQLYTNPQRVFLINGDIITLKKVCDKINAELYKKPDGNYYHIIVVGRKLDRLENLLEEEGLYGKITLHSFQWDMIIIDNRILSLEYNNLYKSLFVNKDQSLLPTVARSIWTLHMLLGKPRMTFVQGKFSHTIDHMIQVLYEELGEPDTKDRDISCFLIVDRDLDYPSALLTGSTYTSILDEEFGISSGSVEVKTNKDSKVVTRCLNSSDEIFEQIKSRHFSDVFPYLKTVVKKLQATQAKSQNLQISEMKTFISQELSSLTNLKKSVAYHISACEAIITQMGQRFEGLQNAEADLINCFNKRQSVNYIEECLSMNTCNRYAILRLICLLSITQDGVSSDEYNQLKSLFLQVYGYQYLPVFYNLEQANLCTYRVGEMLTIRKSTFTSFAQKLKLIPEMTDDYDLKHPKDVGYVFGGNYIPVVCQLVKYICKQMYKPEDIAKLIPNCTVRSDEDQSKNIRCIIVYFVGGVTYAEISAFQLLEKLTGTQIIVAGSSIINGNLLMKSFF